LNIIIYNDQDHSIIQAIKTRTLMFKNCTVTRVTDYKTFKKNLASCFAGECIIVFFINREKDMMFLESVKKQFVDIKLLIYLALEGNDIASRAYALSPRIVISNNSSKELLPEALQGILKNLIKQTYK